MIVLTNYLERAVGAGIDLIPNDHVSRQVDAKICDRLICGKVRLNLAGDNVKVCKLS